MVDEAGRRRHRRAAAVPILPDDTAREVFDKVTVAAEITLDRGAARACVAGTAPRLALDLARGLVFRRPQARGRAHRLVAGRAAHPQPGARGGAALSRAPSPRSPAGRRGCLRTRVLDGAAGRAAAAATVRRATTGWSPTAAAAAAARARARGRRRAADARALAASGAGDVALPLRWRGRSRRPPVKWPATTATSSS